MTDTSRPAVVWKMPALMILIIGIVGVLFGFLFYEELDFISTMWFNKQEYSHGVMIPFISAFLIWQRKDILERMPFTGSVGGLALMLSGVMLFVLGHLSTLIILMNYAMIIVIAGLFLAFMGWQAFRIVIIPTLLLFFMIPLPGFLFETFSDKMQLLSSSLGTEMIRFFGISVFLEGNVIDLGTMKLQVAEACSGLRYLFPLATLGFIAAYFFKDKMWKRIVVVLSSIPITILMNSARIAIIGILVDHGNRSLAEGFLHYFEGWVVFMICTAVLVGEMWALSRIEGTGRPLREVFGLDLPPPSPRDMPVHKRTVPRPFVVSLIAFAATAILFGVLPERVGAIMPRKTFSEFPLQIGSWKGRAEVMEKIYLDILDVDDYFLANYVDPANKNVVNLYVGYYATQLAEKKVPHSPRACLPGGGWTITSLREQVLATSSAHDQPLKVNRLIIEQGDQKQLVYYWFQERGRDITNEYLVKWYIFWDSLTKNRTDGALVRVTTLMGKGEDGAEADKRLISFVKAARPLLSGYIPN